MMRHSVDTASKNYLKVFDEETKSDPEKIQDVNIELEKEIGDVKDENDKLKQELQDVKVHCKDAFKPEDKLYIKRRADILYRYNKKDVEATDKTMTKYNIQYNKAKQLYE
jgi:predicted DNA binding CopG/RHH family protein